MRELEARYGKAPVSFTVSTSEVSYVYQAGKHWTDQLLFDGEDTGTDDDAWKDPDWIRDTY